MPIDLSDNRLHLAALAVIAVGAGMLSNLDPQSRAYDAQAEQADRASELERNQLRNEARQRKRNSPLALTRIKAGCVPVVLQDKTWVSPNLTEGMGAFDEDGLQMMDGLICTVNSTAEVSGGFVTNVVPVPPESLEEYTQFFNQLLTVRGTRFEEIYPTD